MTVRTATGADLAQVPAVELAADARFLSLGIHDLPAPASAADRAASWRVLVATAPGRDGEVVGFAVLELLDGGVHLEQLSVHPAHGRRGIGGALLDAAVRAAEEHGVPRVTLCTYRDVAWNAPFYARHGWRVCTDPTPALAALRAHERDLGLDRHGPRVVMTRPVGPTAGGEVTHNRSACDAPVQEASGARTRGDDHCPPCTG